MSFLKTTLVSMLVLGLLSLTSIASAHIMVAQHGTLNFVDSNVYLVVSLPISAFKDIDDDKNGKVSLIEFNLHRKKITTTIHKNLYLAAEKDKLALEGLLLSPSIAHNSNNNHIDQVTIMGRYSLPNKQAIVNFNINLFGETKELKIYEITATNKKLKLSHKFELTPEQPSKIVFQ